MKCLGVAGGINEITVKRANHWTHCPGAGGVTRVMPSDFISQRPVLGKENKKNLFG